MILEGNAAKKFRETRSQRDRTKPILTTINLERPPLFYGTTSHFKDHAIVVGQVTAEEHKVQSRSRMVTVEKKMQATEKYAMALVSISGQCEVLIRCNEAVKRSDLYSEDSFFDFWIEIEFIPEFDFLIIY